MDHVETLHVLRQVDGEFAPGPEDFALGSNPLALAIFVRKSKLGGRGPEGFGVSSPF